jgi:FkbM family methyltransferase
MNNVEVAKKFARSAGHLYPLRSGCGRLANGRIFRYLAGLGDPEEIAELRDGSLLHVRLDDYVGRAAYFFGDLDPKVTWVCNRLLRPGDQVFDVGANIGLVTMYAARMVGPTGRVDAFEPQQDLAASVAASASLNGFNNVAVHPIALSDQAGRRSMTVPFDNRGAATLGSHSVGIGRRLEVEVHNAADYLESLDRPRARLLKLDVEGHEAAVLSGAASYLEQNGPDAILFEEYNKPALEQRSAQLVISIGYSVFSIPRTLLRPLLQPAEHADGTSHDLVAVRTGPGHSEIINRLHARTG